MIDTNEIANVNVQLPDTLEDLTQFVLVGKTKLNAYMLKLKTVNKLSVAQEIRDQTLQETQEISNALIAAEQRIGELLLAIPKQAGRPSENSSTQVEKLKTKTETVKDMGYSKDEASDYQQMAKYPEVVQKVIDDAIAKGEVVTKASVMREIKFYKDRITELENSKKETITKTVEVVPDDYDELKHKAEMADVHEKDFRDMQKRYEEMAEKWKNADAENAKLKEQSNNSQIQYDKDLKRNIRMFSLGIKNFLEEYSGYVFLGDDWDKMTKSEQKIIYSCLGAMKTWVESMLNSTVQEVIQ